MMLIISMGGDYVSKLLPPTAYCSSPRWWRTMVELVVNRGNPSLVHQSSLAILPAQSSGSKQEEWVKEMRILPFEVFLLFLASHLYML
jgi:hypothetical protein